jgi:hypothetical protein
MNDRATPGPTAKQEHLCSRHLRDGGGYVRGALGSINVGEGFLRRAYLATVFIEVDSLNCHKGWKRKGQSKPEGAQPSYHSQVAKKHRTQQDADCDDPNEREHARCLHASLIGSC